MKCLEIEAAIRYYQIMANSGMVLSLMNLVKEEDASYLQGMCSMLLRKFEQAQARDFKYKGGLYFRLNQFQVKTSHAL